MARLNQFIKVLHDRGGQALTLIGGEPMALSVGGQTLAVTRGPLSATGVLTLVQEIAPAPLADQIGRQDAVSFSYGAPSGAVDVAVEPQATGVRVVLRRSGAHPVAAAVSTEPANGADGRDDASRAAIIDQLLTALLEVGGSDLHLRVGQPALFRHDGRLVRQPGERFDASGIQTLLDAIMPDRDRGRHVETGDADFAYQINGLARFRVNAARDAGGPMAVFRVIPSAIPTCDALDITPEVRNLCHLTKGLVVVTGPTGSGKSTTLAALVNQMNEQREDHILTIEDPIEFMHESKQCLVTHRQVGLHTESFKTGLRAALREDPDVILIGEMRDLETVAIAIETAETGHLVFGTLHTTTAASTIDRIIDQFPADRQAQVRVMLAESLRGVISQTLCRKIGGGRVAAREILLTTPAVSNLIREAKTFQIPSIIQTGRKLGMVTLNQSLLDLVDKEIIEPTEAYLKSVDKMGLQAGLKERGLEASVLAA